ncbi:hypothetical protein C0992_012829, partial [Termitomyces sp. T32_za158]
MDVDGADDESDWLEFSEHEDAGLADEQPDDLGEQDDAGNWEDGAPAEHTQPAPLPLALQAGAGAPHPVQQQQQQSPPEPVYPAVEAPPLRTSSSREQLVEEAHRTIDPAEVTETRKLTMTPTIARSDENKPYSPGEQRVREEEEARKPAAPLKGKMAPPVSSASLSKPTTGARLRKDRESDDESSSGKDKKKRGMFGGLFKSKKDKKEREKNLSTGSSESGDSLSRPSDDSMRSAGNRPSTSDPILSPTTTAAMQQQQQQALNSLRVATAATAGAAVELKRSEPQTPERLPAVSQHA